MANSHNRLHTSTHKRLQGRGPSGQHPKLKKIKLSKELYMMELLPRTHTQYKIHWLLIFDIYDKILRKLGNSYTHWSFTPLLQQALVSHMLGWLTYQMVKLGKLPVKDGRDIFTAGQTSYNVTDLQALDKAATTVITKAHHSYSQLATRLNFENG